MSIWESGSVGKEAQGRVQRPRGQGGSWYPQEILPFPHICPPLSPSWGFLLPVPSEVGGVFQTLVGGGIPQQILPPRGPSLEVKGMGPAPSLLLCSHPCPMRAACQWWPARHCSPSQGLRALFLSLLKPTMYKSITTVYETTKEVKMSSPVPVTEVQLY